MKMTTIRVSEDTKKDLLKVAAGLQANTGKKVDYEQAIMYLVGVSRKRPDVLRRAMISTGATSEELQAMLRAGREEDRRGEAAHLRCSHRN